MTKRPIRLGLSMRYLGYHDAAWRHPDVPAGGSSDYQHFLRCALRAEPVGAGRGAGAGRGVTRGLPPGRFG